MMYIIHNSVIMIMVNFVFIGAGFLCVFVDTDSI